MNRKLAILSAVGIGATLGAVVAVYTSLSASKSPESRAEAPAASSAEPVLPPPPGELRVAIPWLPQTVARFNRVFVSAAEVHGVDPEMLAIVTLVESGGWVGAVSPTGAVGLMQIMPATGKAIGDERGLLTHETGKLGQPEYNIDFGAWYFARMLERFRTEDVTETIKRAASAYNGGPTRLAHHLAGEGDLSDQTKRYRHWVGDMWLERHDKFSPTFQEWLAAGGERLVARAVAEMQARP